METNTHHSSFYEVIARVTEDSDHGTSQAMRTFCVEAASFTEAERIGTEAATGYSTDGTAGITNINPAPYRTVITADIEGAFYFRCKANIVTINEATGKERKTAETYLIQAAGTTEAKRALDTYYSNSALPYNVTAVIQTPIVECLFHGGTAL